MDKLFMEALTSLREGQWTIDQELQPRLQAQEPDWAMLERLRDVADEYAERARQLQLMMTEKVADADLIEEVDRLREYFEGTADLIAQETGDAEDAEAVAAPLTDNEESQGQG